MYKKALETAISVHRGPVGRTRSRGSFNRHFEKKVRFYFYQETSFTKHSERYVKEGFGKEHLSPQGPRQGTGQGLLYREL
jgi:hypothetical protein